MTEEHMERLIETVFAMDKLDDIAKLLDLMVFNKN
jgi:hypothetical protein